VLLEWCDNNTVISYMEVIRLMWTALALLPRGMELKGLKSWLRWSIWRRGWEHSPESII